MRVLVTGATGLIGSAVCARLSAEGHHVIAAIRPGSGPVSLGAAGIAEIDVAKSPQPQDWLPHLVGIEAVVNCVGVFQDNPRDSTKGVHVSGTAALFRACEQQGIRRVIHLSAIGVNRHQPSAFSRTKLEGDKFLMERDLDWVILRPSVVLGQAVFGASALFRGLAAMPIVPRMRRSGPLQVVQLDDLIATVSFFLQDTAPSKVALELAGPERLSVDQVIAAYRKWLGWPPARRVDLPDSLMRLLFRCGDFAGWLGWRPLMRSTATKELAHGAVGDPAAWIETTGIRPSSLSATLARRPVGVQERWFARLYFLKPVTFVVLSLFWILTGIISLTVGFREGVDLMLRAGTSSLAIPGVIAGAIADIAIGAAIARRPWASYGLYAGVALSLFYAIAGTVLLPGLWGEPLGPLMKIWPILVLHLIALAMLKGR